MTPHQLQQMLRGRSPGSWPPPDRPDALLAALERAADASPADRRLASLVREAAHLASAGRGLPVIIAGVRRERLVRWDADSTTWTGVEAATGRPALVRVLRPAVSDDPVLRRQLVRDRRALVEVLPEVRLDGVALVAPCPGLPFEPAEGHPERIARLVATAVRDLEAWEAAGLGLPLLTDEELRIDADGLRIVCLDPVHAPDPGHNLASLSSRLHPDGDGPVATLVSGLAELPPRSAGEAAEHLLEAMAQDLAARRHDLWFRYHRSGHAHQLARLHDTVGRLRAALPPPAGRGAVGVDLEGRITVVHGDGRSVWWGPVDETRPLYTADEGFDAPHARRLLRARASSPPNPRLHAEIGGDPVYTEAIGRWVASALRLRTIALLLDKSLESLR